MCNGCSILFLNTARSANKRKRKSKLETTLEVFVDKIGSALKNEDTDLLLKMQAAQHEHELKMFSMLSQFLERSSHPPQPPFYQAPMQPSQPYSARAPPTHPSPFPVVPGPSNIRPLSFLQDLNQPLLFNSAQSHSHATQSFCETLANAHDYPPAFQSEDEDEM